MLLTVITTLLWQATLNSGRTNVPPEPDRGLSHIAACDHLVSLPHALTHLELPDAFFSCPRGLHGHDGSPVL
jgi:hypothetical protein